jgi:RNA polymerase sigma-70 factor (ECF subfamily)
MTQRVRKLFELFVRENEGALIAYIRTMIRDSSAAEDIFQETLLTAWKKFDEFDSSRPLTPWLRGIALNLIRNAWRRQASEKLIFDDQAIQFAEAGIAAVEKADGDTWYDRLAVLRDCLSLLSPNSRQLVDDCYQRKQSSNEIAERTGMAAATIRKQLQRIREQLAGCIQKRLGESFS